MNTLLLDADSWDIGADAMGNLAIASDTYSIVQDSCAAAQTWLGEVYYDQNLGVPYDDVLLSGKGANPFYSAFVEGAVRLVPGVTSVRCRLIAPSSDRTLTGLLIITTRNGRTIYAAY